MEQPRPSIVRVTKLDGGVDEVTCTGAWTKIADTIEALEPEHLQALNTEKQTIRATRAADLTDDWEHEPDETRAARRAPPPAMPDIAIPAAAMDPETARWALFARLLSDAYKHSSQVAFERLAGIVEALVQRADNADRTREAFYRAHIKALEDQIREMGKEPSEEPGDLVNTIVNSAIGGAIAGMQNGAAKTAAQAAAGAGKAD